MRKLSTWLSILGLSFFVFGANAMAQDEEPAEEAADEVANDAEGGAEDAVAADDQAEAEPEAVAGDSKNDKAAQGAGNPLAEMDAVQSYRYFIELLRACGNDPDYQAKSDKKECDMNALWDAIDVQSKMLFVNAYASLVRVDRIIETYFDPIEFTHMRSRTGTDIIKADKVTDARELFKHIFKSEKLVFNEQTLSGVEYESDEKDKKNPFIVTIHTHYPGQNFVMVRESDNIWRNAGLRNIFQAAVDPIFESEKAMQEYAKDNLTAEIDRRKKVLDYFLLQQAIRAKQK